MYVYIISDFLNIAEISVFALDSFLKCIIILKEKLLITNLLLRHFKWIKNVIKIRRKFFVLFFFLIDLNLKKKNRNSEPIVIKI